MLRAKAPVGDAQKRATILLPHPVQLWVVGSNLNP